MALSDILFAKTLRFKLYMIYVQFWMWYHTISFEGEENLDYNQPSLLITNHSTHNADIFIGFGAFYLLSKKKIIPRGLFHSFLYYFLPYLLCMGGIPGDRHTAIRMLKRGHWMACIPGGGEEAIQGHENSYQLVWQSSASGKPRRGFVYVSKAASVPIIPFIVVNQEEMRFNPLFYIANKTKLSMIYDNITTKCKNIHLLGFILTYLRYIIWFNVSFLCIYVPVKVTYIFGKAIWPLPNESVDSVAERTQKAMEEMLQKHHPNAPDTNYIGAIRQRMRSMSYNEP